MKVDFTTGVKGEKLSQNQQKYFLSGTPKNSASQFNYRREEAEPKEEAFRRFSLSLLY